MKVATKPGISIVLTLVFADNEPMNGVGGRAAECHRHVGWHDNALRNERILLSDEPDRDLAVRPDRRCRGCFRRTHP